MADSQEQLLTSKPVASGTQPLSCVSCRAAKVKCNRIHPCSNCQKSRIQCIFPRRKRNRRSHDTRQRDLLDRVSRLETIVAKVDPKALEGASADSLRDSPPLTAARQEATFLDLFGQHGSSQQVEVSGQLPRQSTQPVNQYLSAHLWAQLCDEVDGLKQTLEVQSDSEDDVDVLLRESVPESQSASYGDNFTLSSAMLGNLAFETGNNIPHPSPRAIIYFCESYFTGVDPVLKILHRPSFSRTVNAFAASGANVSRSGISTATEALLFAMYFGAVTSLAPEMCLADLGETRAVLVNQYRLACEIALTRANYLKSSQLESLQAFAIYTAILRSHDTGRTSWALLGLLTRLAQSLRLHRDGNGSSYSPFEAEMRRRLWWTVVILDMRASEDRGTEPIVNSERFDTPMPTNINDADFGPETTMALKERDGPSDITFTICLAMCSRIHLQINKLLTSSGNDATATASDSQADEEIISYVRLLEARFIDSADRAHLISYLTAGTVRLIVLKLWLDVQYPVRVLPIRGGSTPTVAGRCSRVSREVMLRTAGLVIELAESAESTPEAERFHWWCRTFVQWHALAVALAELCTQTQGEVVERAWRIIDTVFQRWSIRVADSDTGMLWRPIKKLYKKAKAARSMAVEYASVGSGNTSSNLTNRYIIDAANNFTESAPERLESDELSLPGFILEAPSFVPADLVGEDWIEQGMEEWIDWNEFVIDASGSVDR